MQIALVFFAGLLLDGLWLGIAAKSLYAFYLGDLMIDRPRFVAAGLVYILMTLGLFVFVRPLTEHGSLFGAFLCGALFGCILYGVYDLTNLAVLKQWSWQLSLIDVAWGTVLCGTLSALQWYLQHR